MDDIQMRERFGLLFDEIFGSQEEEMAKISEQAQKAASIQPSGANMVSLGDGRMTGPPPDMDEAEFRATAGAGLSTKQSDNVVPIIYILHYTSPQVDERDPAYVRGARPGDLLLRGAPEGEELVSSAEGILFQPCEFWNDVTEWVPRQTGGGGGKGFVAKHLVESAREVPGAKTGPKGKFHWTTADGAHDLEDTRNFAGYVYLKSGLRMPFLIPLKGSGHAVGKAWMAKMNAKLSPSGQPYASFAMLYRLRTEPRSNEQGKWFMYTVSDVRWATREERAAGRRLHEQFKSGEKIAEEPTEDLMSAEKAVTHTSPVDASRVDASI
jgi:hypothetical protein